MPDSLSITFRALAESGEVASVDILVGALDVDHPRIPDLAVEALLTRNSVRGHVEVVRRLPRLSPEARKLLDQRSARLAASLRQCLLHADDEVRYNALEIVEACEIYELFSAVLELLKEGAPEIRDRAAAALRHLVRQLYEQCRAGTKPRGRALHDAAQVRQQVLAALDQALSKIEAVQQAGDILESILILGEPDSFAVQRALAHSSPQCREIIQQHLLSSRHPGVMQFLLDSLAKNYPSRKVFEAIEHRKDLDFICHLLRWLPKQPTEIQKKNFRQITAVEWLDNFEVVLQIIPPALQGPAMEFVALIGIPEDLKHRIQQWVIRHGSSDGRLAAAGILAAVDQGSMRELIFDSLDSEEPEVQAWATSQLRASGIPAALTLLIERVDSPLEAVRAAAREELQSFNLECLLKLFEHLEPEVCVRAAELAQKIHPQFVDELRQELTSPLRYRRLRAARAAQAMQLQAKVATEVGALAQEDDALVRRIAAEMLGDIPSLESLEILHTLRSDPSRRVREAAVRSLDQLRERGLFEPMEFGMSDSGPPR